MKYIKCKECGHNTFKRYKFEGEVKIKQTKFADTDTDCYFDDSTNNFKYFCDLCGCELDS